MHTPEPSLRVVRPLTLPLSTAAHPMSAWTASFTALDSALLFVIYTEPVSSDEYSGTVRKKESTHIPPRKRRSMHHPSHGRCSEERCGGPAASCQGGTGRQRASRLEWCRMRWARTSHALREDPGVKPGRQLGPQELPRKEEEK